MMSAGAHAARPGSRLSRASPARSRTRASALSRARAAEDRRCWPYGAKCRRLTRRETENLRGDERDHDHAGAQSVDDVLTDKKPQEIRGRGERGIGPRKFKAGVAVSFNEGPRATASRPGWPSSAKAMISRIIFGVQYRRKCRQRRGRFLLGHGGVEIADLGACAQVCRACRWSSRQSSARFVLPSTTPDRGARQQSGERRNAERAEARNTLAPKPRRACPRQRSPPSPPFRRAAARNDKMPSGAGRERARHCCRAHCAADVANQDDCPISSTPCRGVDTRVPDWQGCCASSSLRAARIASGAIGACGWAAAGGADLGKNPRSRTGRSPSARSSPGRAQDAPAIARQNRRRRPSSSSTCSTSTPRISAMLVAIVGQGKAVRKIFFSGVAIMTAKGAPPMTIWTRASTATARLSSGPLSQPEL